MNYHEVMDVNAKSDHRKGPKVLRSLEHERSANGGHVFTHRFVNSNGHYHESESHTFGKDEGKKVAAHFAKHAGIEVKADEDSAAGAAT